MVYYMQLLIIIKKGEQQNPVLKFFDFPLFCVPALVELVLNYQFLDSCHAPQQNQKPKLLYHEVGHTML